MSEQRDSEARGDDPLTCSKCGGPTKENGRWHPDIGAVYGYELGLAERDPAPDTPEDTSRVEEDEPIDLTTPVRTRARLAAWREVEGDISGYDSEGYQRMIDHWPVVDDPERLGEVDEGESRVETTSGLQQLAARERRIARNLIAALEQGRYVDAEDIGEDLRPWVPSKLAQRIAQVEADQPATEERGE